jgi:carboxypeptidase C (cathepsin A)
MAYYEAGHMMYIHKPSLVKLKEDLSRFLTAAVSSSPSQAATGSR